MIIALNQHSGLLTQWTKMYQLSLFGAATEKLMKATIDGDLKEGVQFVGQTQGVIKDIPSVEELLDRVVGEAVSTHKRIGEQHMNTAYTSSESDDSAATMVLVESANSQQQVMNDAR